MQSSEIQQTKLVQQAHIFFEILQNWFAKRKTEEA